MVVRRPRLVTFFFSAPHCLHRPVLIIATTCHNHAKATEKQRWNNASLACSCAFFSGGGLTACYAGADPKTVDRDGHSAFELARRGKHKGTMRMLGKRATGFAFSVWGVAFKLARKVKRKGTVGMLVKGARK
jgi:hypothetical protein